MTASIASVSFSSGIYQGQIGTDVKVAMEGEGVHSGAYTRMPFTLVGDPEALDCLKLDIQYDDGFVAYLNGVKIAQRNAPVSPVWNSVANSDLSDLLALTAERIDISAHLPQLVTGSNVLAIHGLNAGVSADHFLIRPTLSASSVTGTLFFQSPTPDAANGVTGTLPYGYSEECLWCSLR